MQTMFNRLPLRKNEYIENNTWVRGNTRFIRVLNMIYHEKYVHATRSRNKSGDFQAPMHFSVCYINYRYFTYIKYPEAMIGDCLKSDNFHM